jgi:hypothetical protein
MTRSNIWSLRNTRGMKLVINDLTRDGSIKFEIDESTISPRDLGDQVLSVTSISSTFDPNLSAPFTVDLAAPDFAKRLYDHRTAIRSESDISRGRPLQITSVSDSRRRKCVRR